MIVGALLIICLLVAFPTTTVGKALREVLVDLPARRLGGVTPGRIVFYVCLGLVGLALFYLFKEEGLRLFGFMAPDLIVWFTVFDVSVFLDFLILSIALTATIRLRVIRANIVQGLNRLWSLLVTRGHARDRAVKSPKTRGSKAFPDDPDPAGYGLAWA